MRQPATAAALDTDATPINGSAASSVAGGIAPATSHAAARPGQ